MRGIIPFLIVLLGIGGVFVMDNPPPKAQAKTADVVVQQSPETPKEEPKPVEQPVAVAETPKVPDPVVEAPKPAPAPVVAPVSVSEAEAKAFIYQHESGNRLDAINHLGCKGLGQDCNNALPVACPNWKTDRPCQDAFWEAYMKRRYGSWVKARAFWLARVPINGKDVGNWW